MTDNDDLMQRRRILKIPFHEVLNNMTGLHDVEHIIHRTILPDDVRILSVRQCMKSKYFIFELCHETFDIVPIGADSPNMCTGYTISQTYDVQPRTIDFLRAKDEGNFK